VIQERFRWRANVTGVKSKINFHLILITLLQREQEDQIGMEIAGKYQLLTVKGTADVQETNYM
jgi:hypothetical protein